MDSARAATGQGQLYGMQRGGGRGTKMPFQKILISLATGKGHENLFINIHETQLSLNNQ